MGISTVKENHIELAVTDIIHYKKTDRYKDIQLLLYGY